MIKRFLTLVFALSLLHLSVAPVYALSREQQREMIMEQRELMKALRNENNGSSRLSELREELESLQAAIREMKLRRSEEWKKERQNRIESRRLLRQQQQQQQQQEQRQEQESARKPLTLVPLRTNRTSPASPSPSPSITATEYGKASYYAEKFNGRTTASGEIFSNSLMTAAHKTLPFGTRVRVTNQSNGNSIEVVINDRGPYVEGRIIDLSSAAFSSLDNLSRGVLDVRVDILD